MKRLTAVLLPALCCLSCLVGTALGESFVEKFDGDPGWAHMDEETVYSDAVYLNGSGSAAMKKGITPMTILLMDVSPLMPWST